MVQVEFLPITSPKTLYPLTAFESSKNLLWGAASLQEIWKFKIQKEVPQLRDFGHKISIRENLVPSTVAWRDIEEAGPDSTWVQGGEILFQWTSDQKAEMTTREVPTTWQVLSRPTDWFSLADDAIQESMDFAKTKWRLTLANQLPDHVTLIGPVERVWIGPDVKLTACTLNATTGPIVIGPEAEIQEGCHIRGPLILGRESVLKMGCRIYGPTVIGPQCKVGGEISNSVFLGHSNKAHDGFLGNSVIGQWCNLGADTNTSNLKNTYGDIRLYNHESETLEPTGLQFCGLILGDHSKCGINAMFNTGTVVGPGCNIYDSGFPPKHVPAFRWGSAQGGWVEHNVEKMLVTAKAVMARRGVTLTAEAEDRIRTAHASAFPSGNG
ncbi:MAG: glucose-1-phosphate thymidylyltransferase [Flavobacteriales bacterium]